MLGGFEVHAGDFRKGNWSQFIRQGSMASKKGWTWKSYTDSGKLPSHFLMKVEGQFSREKISVYQIDQLEIASEENVVRIGGAAGWGIAGAVLLGPIGLLAGLIAGGKGKQVTFVCKFKDGRKFLGSAPAKLYTKMVAEIF